MKSFRFSLETVLKARVAQEDEARRQLAVALAAQCAAVARSQEAVFALNALHWAVTTESATSFSVAQRERSWSARQLLEKTCAELRAAAQECVRVTDERRAAVLQTRHNRAVLERLKAARYAEWQREADQAEQHQFDEFA